MYKTAPIIFDCFLEVPNNLTWLSIIHSGKLKKIPENGYIRNNLKGPYIEQITSLTALKALYVAFPLDWTWADYFFSIPNSVEELELNLEGTLASDFYPKPLKQLKVKKLVVRNFVHISGGLNGIIKYLPQSCEKLEIHFSGNGEKQLLPTYIFSHNLYNIKTFIVFDFSSEQNIPALENMIRSMDNLETLVLRDWKFVKKSWFTKSCRNFGSILRRLPKKLRILSIGSSQEVVPLCSSDIDALRKSQNLSIFMY